MDPITVIDGPVSVLDRDDVDTDQIRNFEGRQGRGGRTHLVSPEMAAAAAIEGHFVDIRDRT